MEKFPLEAQKHSPPLPLFPVFKRFNPNPQNFQQRKKLHNNFDLKNIKISRDFCRWDWGENDMEVKTKYFKSLVEDTLVGEYEYISPLIKTDTIYCKGECWKASIYKNGFHILAWKVETHARTNLTIFNIFNIH